VPNFKTNHRRIVVHDVFGTRTANDPSIHSLLWEVLERHKQWPRTHHSPRPAPVQRVRVYRTLHVDPDPSCKLGLLNRSKTWAIGDNRDEYRILLVIARSFRRSVGMGYIDFRPSIIQSPLLNIALHLRNKGIVPRLRVETIRPGTFGELENHLEESRKSGRPAFDLVHFDLHGKLK
jgi:hypothetical protein